MASLYLQACGVVLMLSAVMQVQSSPRLQLQVPQCSHTLDRPGPPLELRVNCPPIQILTTKCVIYTISPINKAQNVQPIQLTKHTLAHQPSAFLEKARKLTIHGPSTQYLA